MKARPDKSSWQKVCIRTFLEVSSTCRPEQICAGFCIGWLQLFWKSVNKSRSHSIYDMWGWHENKESRELEGKLVSLYCRYHNTLTSTIRWRNALTGKYHTRLHFKPIERCTMYIPCNVQDIYFFFRLLIMNYAQNKQTMEIKNTTRANINACLSAC